MTVATSSNRVDYTGNGSTTVFSFSFRIFENSDIVVTQATDEGVETELTLGTDYTVSGAGSYNGGSITLATALTSGYSLTIQRVLEITQETDLRNQGQFFAETHEDVFDRLIMITQQLQEQIDRSAKLPVTNTSDAEELVTDIVALADKLLELTAIYNKLAEIETVADDLNEDTSEINTVAVNITNVNLVGGSITNVNTVADNIVDIQNAEENADAAAESAALAEEWAIKTGSPVEGSEYSAKYHAQSASAYATNASTSASTAATEAGNAETSATNAANSASDAATSATNAETSATNAANSAALAAASAAAGLYGAVVDKTSNYTVQLSDDGALIRATTTSGAVTITLPQISTLADGFKVAVVKWTGDSNGVSVVRSGSDTINGASSYAISSQYNSGTFVADFETNQWFAVSSGVGATNINIDGFSGDASAVAFTLSGDPGNEQNTQVFVDGVYQQKSTYSVSGSTLTFSTAPPTGSSNVEVVWTTPLAIGTPSDGSVTADKMAAGAAAANLGFTPADDSLVMHLAGAETATGAKRGAVSALGNQSGTVTLDLATSNNFSMTLTGSSTLANPSNQVAGQGGVITITQDGTGSRTLAYGGYWKFPGGTAPTLTTTAGAVDVLAYQVESATRITARLIGDVK